MDIEGKILYGILHFNRCKHAFLRTRKVLASTLADLKQIINLGTRISEKIFCMKDCMMDVL